MFEGQKEPIWKWLGRADIVWSLSEFVRQWIWNPYGGSAVVAVFAAILRWLLGIPFSEAMVTVAAIVVAFAGIVWLTRYSPIAQTDSASLGSNLFVSKVNRGILFLLIISLFHSLYLQREMGLVRDDMVRYVIPRSLTPEQKATVAKYLSTSTPHALIMKVTSWNEEASSYAVDLRQALENGGWPVGSIIYDDAVPEGVRVDMSEPMQESKPGPVDPFDGLKDRLNPKKKPPDIIREAFEQAGVIVEGGSGSGIGITTTTITIFVGNRRRDKLAIPPP